MVMVVVIRAVRCVGAVLDVVVRRSSTIGHE